MYRYANPIVNKKKTSSFGFNVQVSVS